MPELIQLIGVETNWLLSPYVGVVMGGLLLYFLSLLVADYFVRLIKLLEEAILKAPVTDVLIQSMEQDHYAVLCKSKWRIGYLKSC